MKNICLVLVSSLIFTVSCVKNPVTGDRELRLVSENQERQLGNEAYKTATQAQGGPFVIDPKLTESVSNVCHRLALQSDRPTLAYELVIINDSTPNAWALPGGK